MPNRYERARYEEPERRRSTQGRSRRRKGGYELHNLQTPLDYFGLVAKYVLIILLIMVFISFCKKSYRIGYSIFSEAPADSKGEGIEVTIEVTSGMSVEQIGTLLEEEGILEDGSVFPFQERFSSNHGKIIPGTYKVSSEMTPEEIIGVMSANYPDDEEEAVQGASSNLAKSLLNVLSE